MTDLKFENRTHTPSCTGTSDLKVPNINSGMLASRQGRLVWALQGKQWVINKSRNSPILEHVLYSSNFILSVGGFFTVGSTLKP